jgi:uncharacterized protein (DUF1810 family)
MKKFLDAQEDDYLVALNEIKNGHKRSHWIWYIFPQIDGLGHSSIAKYYSIKDLEEAKEYLNNEILRSRLIEISNELLKLNDSIDNIMGYPDNLKLCSCMTLFYEADPSIDVFKKVIDKFYNGKFDENTIRILKK